MVFWDAILKSCILSMSVEQCKNTKVYPKVWWSRRWVFSAAGHSEVGGAMLKVLSRVKAAVCSVQCTVYSVQCAVCSVQCAVCSVQCAVCSVQCAVWQKKPVRLPAAKAAEKSLFGDWRKIDGQIWLKLCQPTSQPCSCVWAGTWTMICNNSVF